MLRIKKNEQLAFSSKDLNESVSRFLTFLYKSFFIFFIFESSFVGYLICISLVDWFLFHSHILDVSYRAFNALSVKSYNITPSMPVNLNGLHFFSFSFSPRFSWRDRRNQSSALYLLCLRTALNYLLRWAIQVTFSVEISRCN